MNSFINILDFTNVLFETANNLGDLSGEDVIKGIVFIGVVGLFKGNNGTRNSNNNNTTINFYLDKDTDKDDNVDAEN